MEDPKGKKRSGLVVLTLKIPFHCLRNIIYDKVLHNEKVVVQDEKRLAIKKAKEELEKWLQANPKMTPRVRYSKAHEWFAADPEWKSVGDDDRREIFRDVQNFLDRQERVRCQSTSLVLPLTNSKWCVFRKRKK